MSGYTAGQLKRYYDWCKAHPHGRVLPPGGKANWDEMTVMDWMQWFRDCLMAKINRMMPAAGKGNAARRRMEYMADAKATCKWCGTHTGDRNWMFCGRDCQGSYYS